jgi:hypothetical protein
MTFAAGRTHPQVTVCYKAQFGGWGRSPVGERLQVTVCYKARFGGAQAVAGG